MFAKGFFPGGYFPSGYFPPSGASVPGAPPDYDLTFHVGTAQEATFRMEQLNRTLRLHTGNGQAVRLRD